jgi:hypothetical protein
MKTTAYILEYIEGSDDPRAIEGGGGPKWRVIDKRTASLWLLRAYVKALTNRYDEQYKLEIISGGAA